MGPTLPPMCPAPPIRGPNTAHLRAQYCPPCAQRCAIVCLPRTCGLPGSVRCGGFQLQKQKSGCFCNFFAIRDSFSPLQSENRLLRSCSPAVLRCRSAPWRPATIPNRKKSCNLGQFFVFWILVRVQSSMVPLVGLPLSPPFAPKASERGRFALKPMVQWRDLWRRCRRAQGGWKKSPTFSHRPQNRYLGVLFGL